MTWHKVRRTGDVAQVVKSAPSGMCDTLRTSASRWYADGSLHHDPMTPVVSWPGGKRRLLSHILPLFPEHTSYVEPFGGGLAVLLAKTPSTVEVVNDLDEQLVTFYRVVQHHPQALLDELTWLPRSRATFEELLAQPGVTDIQRAARWFAANKLSFARRASTLGRASYGLALRGSGGTRGSSSLHERLDRVYIERLDWRELLPRYDRAGALFYVDPPYTAGHQYAVGRVGRGRPRRAAGLRCSRSRATGYSRTTIASWCATSTARAVRLAA